MIFFNFYLNFDRTFPGFKQIVETLSDAALPMSNKKDVRIIWVNMRDFRLRGRWFGLHSRHCTCYVSEQL